MSRADINELLRPRYKVIADYPGNDYGVYEIIPLSEYMGLYALIQDDGKFVEWESFYREFPHLFQKLEWWEDREEKDMPEYVKWNYNNAPEFGNVEKVEKWSPFIDTMTAKVPSQVNDIRASYFVPATKEEYIKDKTLIL